MKVQQHKIGSVDVILPGGPLIDEDTTAFEAAMRSHLQAASPHLVVGLQHVTYMDSLGLELLLQLARNLRVRSMPLKLAGLTPTCREILDLTDLMGEFEIFDDVEDAVRSFS